MAIMSAAINKCHRCGRIFCQFLHFLLIAPLKSDTHVRRAQLIAGSIMRSTRTFVITVSNDRVSCRPHLEERLRTLLPLPGCRCEVIRQYDSCNTGELDRHAQHQQPCLANRTLRVIVRQEQPVLSGTHWSSFAHRQMSVVLCLRRFPMKIENCHIRHQRPLKVHQRPPR